MIASIHRTYVIKVAQLASNPQKLTAFRAFTMQVFNRMELEFVIKGIMKIHQIVSVLNVINLDCLVMGRVQMPVLLVT